MSLRRQRPSDSTDLLLDTMCNAFGGIILLAVLVTLLARHERLAAHGGGAESREILERRIELAHQSLAAASQHLEQLRTESANPRWREQLAALKVRADLETRRRTAQAEIAAQARVAEELSASDPSARANSLNAELLSEKTRQTELRNRLGAAEEDLARLRKRLSDLERQQVVKSNELVRALRLPKEHETSQDVLYIIVQHGRVYPCRNADLSRNETSIKWTSSGASSLAEPIAGRGMDALRSPAEFQTYLNQLRGTGMYLAFLVFADSFDQFNRVKQMAVVSGFATGWEPFRKEDGPVSFGPIGFRPKPQ